MEKTRPVEEEMNLTDLLIIIIKGKYKIIFAIIISLAVGLIYNNINKTTQIYEVSLNVSPSDNSKFIKYLSINEILLTNKMLTSNQYADVYLVNNKIIFQKFISEFMDYRELRSVLENNPYVQGQITKLSAKEKEQAITNFAKNFKVIFPTRDKKKKQVYTIVFQWHDVDHGKKILNDTFKLVLSNIKKSTIQRLNDLAEIIVVKNANEIETLNLKFKFIYQAQLDKDLANIQYLKEQSEIAKELDILFNQLDSVALSKTSSSGVSLNINSSEIPYYLRGYKAIDKEISLIQNREYKYENNTINSEEYYQTKRQLHKIKSNLSGKKLLENITIIKNDNERDWINYSTMYADVFELKNNIPTSMILMLFTSIGLIIGALYVLLSHAINSRN